MARYKLQGIARDGAGNIIADASVSVYLSGTTTDASVYEASSGGTAVNSVDTDDEGFYYFYVDSSDYVFSQNFKVTISKSGYTSKTFDEISIFPSPLLMDGGIPDLGSNGVTVEGTIGEDVDLGEVLYCKSDGKYWLADASASTTMPCLAIATEAGSADDEITLLVLGFIRNDTWALTAGSVLYVSTTAGALTETAPSTSGEQVQSIGTAMDTGLVYFNPNDVLVEIDDGTALIPTGGTTGQVLAKDSGTDYDVAWTTIYQMESGGTTGQILTKASDDDYDVEWVSTADGAYVPTGALFPYIGASAPTGYLLCDGASCLRASYAALFAIIGTTYGSADGTHFNVPDLRGRIPVGAGTGTGGGSSGTGAPTGGSALTARARGAWGGDETHVLTEAELPSTAGSHSHGLTVDGYSPACLGSGNAYNITTGTFGDFFSGQLTTESASAFSGSDDPHNNIQPFIVTNYIIKV
jgi:microcystin-dependent protein